MTHHREFSSQHQAWVELSDTASVFADGVIYSAFERNSYLARVTFLSQPDDPVIVVLPKGSRMSRPGTIDIPQIAQEAYSSAERVVVMEGA